MANTFRLYGPAVGKSVPVVDADIDGVNLDGSIQLVPQTTELDAFTISKEKLAALTDDNLVYDKANVNTSDPAWGAISDVNARKQNDGGDTSQYDEAMKSLFQGVN